MQTGPETADSQNPYDDITDNLGYSKTGEYPSPDRAKDDCNPNYKNKSVHENPFDVQKANIFEVC